MNTRVRNLLFNTNKIPTFYEKTRLIKNDTVLGSSILIKTNIPLDILISNITFVLEAGEHYIPPHFHVYCDLKILTDISNNNEVEVYYSCKMDDISYEKYNEPHNFCANNFSILVPSLISKHTGNPACFKKGICTDNIACNFLNIFK